MCGLDSFAGAALYLALLLLFQLRVVVATDRTPALRPWRFVLALTALLWWLVPLLKKAFIDQVFYPDDSVFHEETARTVAYLLHHQDWQAAWYYAGFGNDGYRFVLGVFYWITGAPETVTYGVQGWLAFWGLLSLLETACFHVGARCVPLWVVGLVGLNPSAIFWTTFNLKEGAMLWGICMVLRASLRFGERVSRESLTWPVVGLFTASFLRPHIAACYLAGLGVALAIRQRRIGVAIASAGGMVAAMLMLQTIAPAMCERIMDDGLGQALSERFQDVEDEGGSAISYAGGNPIPVVSGAILITLRPFPWEVNDVTTVAAGAEIWLISGAFLVGWYRMRNRRQWLRSSYTLVLIMAAVGLSYYFTYVYNMGLMVRQRVMAYPALISLAVLPSLMAVVRYRRLAGGRFAPGTLRSGPVGLTPGPQPWPPSAPRGPRLFTGPRRRPVAPFAAGARHGR